MLIVMLCLLTAGCGGTTKDNDYGTSRLEKVAVPDCTQAGQAEGKWQIAYNKGIELANAGNFAEASYYFSNALGTSPGNFTVIDAYTKTMLELAKGDASVLLIIEGFLSSQIPLVDVDEVEKVLTILKDVRRKIDTAGQPNETNNPQLDTLLTEIENGQYKISADAGVESLQESLENLNDLQDYITNRNTDKETVTKIDELINQAQGLLQYQILNTLLKSRKMSIQESVKTSTAVSEYQLQESEQILREMIALRIPSLTEKINNEIQVLRDLAKQITEAKSMELWNETRSKLENLKEQRVTIGKSKNSNRICQQQLEVLQQEAALLQNTILSLTGKGLDEAIAWREQLAQTATQLSNEQSEKYNNWALHNIQSCLNECHQGVGWLANGQEGRKKISSSLIQYLGPIDRRFLTAEVSRAYDEVLNKYMAPNQLNPVKDETSIDEKGNILYTLKEMYGKPKKQLSDF
ncbi:hypothetical protein FACS189454_09110 [Planctomycetales bacterium]|nr:hypothetical protein FACS189454_09110 [Planctomycetales bacterium]